MLPSRPHLRTCRCSLDPLTVSLPGRCWPVCRRVPIWCGRACNGKASIPSPSSTMASPSISRSTVRETSLTSRPIPRWTHQRLHEGERGGGRGEARRVPRREGEDGRWHWFYCVAALVDRPVADSGQAFSTVQELVQYFQRHSLSRHFPGMETTLRIPFRYGGRVLATADGHCCAFTKGCHGCREAALGVDPASYVGCLAPNAGGLQQGRMFSTGV
jgi:hypothetical protein